MSKTLLDKVWEAHAVRELSNGATQLLIGTHLIHEVTSPQAFGMLRDLGVKVPISALSPPSITLSPPMNAKSPSQINSRTK
jgi:homoaconitase/3-isopropylmalate dehydratase large subunit